MPKNWLIIKINLYYIINFIVTPLVIFIYTHIITYLTIYKYLYKQVPIEKIIIRNFITLNINFIFIKISFLKYYILYWNNKIKYKYFYLSIITIHFIQILKKNILLILIKIPKLFNFLTIFSLYNAVYTIKRKLHPNVNIFNTLGFYLVFSFQIFVGITTLLLGLTFIMTTGGVALLQFLDNVLEVFVYVIFATAKFLVQFFLFFSNFFFEKTLVFTTFSTRLIAFPLIAGVITEYCCLILAFFDYIWALFCSTHFLLFTPLEFLDDVRINNSTLPEFYEYVPKFPLAASWFDFLLHNLTSAGLVNFLRLSLGQTILTYYLIFFDGGSLWSSFLNFSSLIALIAEACASFTACEFCGFFTDWSWSLVGGEFILRKVVPILEPIVYLAPNVGVLSALGGALFLPLIGFWTTLLTGLVCAVSGAINFVIIWYFFMFSYSLVFDAWFYFFLSSFVWFVGVGMHAILGASFSLFYSGVDCLLKLAAWFMLESLFISYFGLMLDFFMVFSHFYTFSSLAFFNFLFIASNLSDFYAGALSFDPGAIIIYYYAFTFLVVVIISGVGKLLVLSVFRGISWLGAPADGRGVLGRRSCLEVPLYDLENRLFGGVDSERAVSRYRLCIKRRSFVSRSLALVEQLVYAVFYWALGGFYYKRVCLVHRFAAKVLHVQNLSSFYTVARGFLSSCVNLLVVKTIRLVDTLGQLGTYIRLALFLDRKSSDTGFMTNRAIFVRINLVSSLPFFLLTCFSDNFLWMGTYRGGAEQFCITNSFLVSDPASAINPTMNSRFMRELGATQLRFSEHGGWGANSFVARYFKMVDEFGLSQLSSDNLQYTHPTIFLSSTSELSLLNAQFVAHNAFISIFVEGFSFVPLMGLGLETADDLSGVSWFYDVVSSLYRFMGGWSSNNFLVPVTTVIFTPLSLIVAQFINFMLDFLELDSAFGWGALDMPELWRLQNSVYSLQNLISGVIFSSEETTSLVTQRALDNQTLRANVFAVWRWLYLVRAQYRLFGGAYEFPRILCGDLPKQIYYSPNPYYSFELLPEFFNPLSIFLDSPSLRANFGFPFGRAHLTSSRSGGGYGEVALPSLRVFALKPSGRIVPRTLLLTNSLNFVDSFKLSEVKYKRLYLEFLGTRVFRRYNYYFSELSGVDSVQNELYSIGRWGTDSLLYDKFSKHFASNYWGKKQAMSLQFLEYDKYQYFKKLKIEFLDSTFGYLGSLKRKIDVSRDSTFRYLDSSRRDRLIQQIAFFFFTVYDEFLNLPLLNRRTPFLTSSAVVDELFSCSFVYNGWFFTPLLYSGGLLYFLEFNFLHFFLKLCSFFSHVGVLPYLPLTTLIGMRIAEFAKFGGLPLDFGADSQIFHLYVARTNAVLFINKGINLKLEGLCIPGMYTKI